MDIKNILEHYDDMFGKYSLEDIEDYLVRNIDEARNKNLNDILFTLLNEMIGFCRDTTQTSKGIQYCKELKYVLDLLDISGTYEYATCLLNLANAYRAFGLYKESLDYFMQCESIYNDILDEYDYGWANLYNNYGLLFQETKEFNKSVDILMKAMHVIDCYKEALIPQAITRTNISVSLIYINTQESMVKALQYLKEAYNIFVEDGENDFHYSACLTALGDAYNALKDYSSSACYYKKALEELNKHVGKNDNYYRVLEKYEYVLSYISYKSNLDLSYEYYINHVKQLLEQEFSEYKDMLAIGMVGEGSDCYGYDDEISKDHDLDIGFCIWLKEDDYNEIGSQLQEFYDCIFNHQGRLKQRRGVMSINSFYNTLLNTNKDYENGDSIDFENIDEYRLSSVTNGKVFDDHLGLFTCIRESILSYYPNDIYRKKLANALHLFSQYAQSNYERMLCRNDIVSASICKSKAVETTMDIIYLLDKQYAPYYKWKHKGLKNSKLGQRIIPLLEKLVSTPITLSSYTYNSLYINKEDKNIALFEDIASIIKDELKRLGYIDNDDLFLEYHIPKVLGETRMNYIDEIIKIEWDMFDKTQNKGGRASCQNNYPTFNIMRKSQYMTFNEALLKSYYNDLIIAKDKGWNLITEKYARMMESTHNDEYKEIEKYLEKRDEQRIRIQEEIIKIQVNWMEELAHKFPKMTSQARVLKTIDDNFFETSYETYLRGELLTYSDATFMLYGKFIIEMLKNEKNLAYEIINNTAKMYGYKDIEDAEKKI